MPKAISWTACTRSSARGSSGDAGTWTGQTPNTNLTRLNTALFSNPLAAFQSECGLGASSSFANQGWYDNAIAPFREDPANPNIVFVGGIVITDVGIFQVNCHLTRPSLYFRHGQAG